MLKKKIFLLILLSFILAFCFTSFSIYKFSKYYSEKPSDVAIVLGAGTKNGKLSKVFEERINHAISLFKRGKVNAVIFTGGIGENQTQSDSEIAKEYAILKKVDVSRIFIEERSTITFYNFAFAKQIMDENKFKSALIVSDPLHMKRSMAMSKHFNISGLPSPTKTSAYKSKGTKSKFLVRETLFYWGFCLLGKHRDGSS